MNNTTKKFDLSVLNSTTYTTNLPSGLELKLHPISAKQSMQIDAAESSTMDILQSSVITPDVIIKNLSISDVETIFNHIFMLEHGNKHTVKYTCTAPVEPEEPTDAELELLLAGGLPEEQELTCGKTITQEINLENAFVSNNTFTKTLVVNEKVTIELQQPTADDFEQHAVDTTSGLLELCKASIKTVYVGEQTFTESDLEQDGLIYKVIDELDNTSFLEVVKWVREAPRLMLFVDLACDCGNSNKVVLRGLDDIFATLGG